MATTTATQTTAVAAPQYLRSTSDRRASGAQSIDVPRTIPGNQPVSLDATEVAIVRLIADGRTNAGIARTLGLSLQTVKNKLTAIYERGRFGNRTQLALFWIASGLEAGYAHAEAANKGQGELHDAA